MANIATDILTNLYDVFKNQRLTAVTGTYDGLTASVSLTFQEGDTETQEFQYSGVEYVEFKEYLFQAAGECVKRHNANYYVQDRSAFIASVTE